MDEIRIFHGPFSPCVAFHSSTSGQALRQSLLWRIFLPFSRSHFSRPRRSWYVGRFITFFWTSGTIFTSTPFAGLTGTSSATAIRERNKPIREMDFFMLFLLYTWSVETPSLFRC